MNGYVIAHVIAHGMNAGGWRRRRVKTMGITMKDIARLAGVSVNTVSRALNGKPEIDEKTRQRILEIAREHSYSPNSLAASLASKKTRTVGLIVPDICDPFYAQQARGVEDMARARGYTVILINTDEDPKTELKAVDTLRSKRVDGMLLTSVFPGIDHVVLLQKQHIPFVLLNRRLTSLDTDYVVNDNIKGAYEATRHLIRLGHTRIAHITGPERITSVRERLAGYTKAIQEAGLSIQDDLVFTGESLKPQSGEVLARRALSVNPRPTAIFAFCDTLAMGAYATAKEMGLMVPEDLAIVGYDDIPFAACFEVPLTTVAQPSYEMGRTACKILLDRIESGGNDQEQEGVPKGQVVFDARLVIRKSCGAYLGQERRRQNLAVIKG
ncbi:MAG TPA: LacI family transcriptional regulator [Firmicutes bacterium]|nr:LacI family transcriptional regulator [Bacillota bacterium]